MPRNKSPDLHKYNIRLRRGDFETLQEYFPDVPTNQVIRGLVAAYVDKLRKQVQEESA